MIEMVEKFITFHTVEKFEKSINLRTSQYTRFFQNLSLYNVNGGFSSMKPCLVPLERALLLTVFGQVVVAPFEF